MSFQTTQGVRSHPQGEKRKSLELFIRIRSGLIGKLFGTEDKEQSPCFYSRLSE